MYLSKLESGTGESRTKRHQQLSPNVVIRPVKVWLKKCLICLYLLLMMETERTDFSTWRYISAPSSQPMHGPLVRGHFCAQAETKSVVQRHIYSHSRLVPLAGLSGNFIHPETCWLGHSQLTVVVPLLPFPNVLTNKASSTTLLSVIIDHLINLAGVQKAHAVTLSRSANKEKNTCCDTSF